MTLARAIFLGAEESDGAWGVYVIVAMVLAPCVIGRALYFWDRYRARPARDGRAPRG